MWPTLCLLLGLVDLFSYFSKDIGFCQYGCSAGTIEGLSGEGVVEGDVVLSIVEEVGVVAEVGILGLEWIRQCLHSTYDVNYARSNNARISFFNLDISHPLGKT